MSDRALARIRIVDDEAAQLQALHDTLRDQGYDIEGYGAAAAALEALERSKFDILLSDLMMPGVDGIELLHTAAARDPKLIGIIMTGQGTIDTAVTAMKSGAFDYILKPLRLRTMLPVMTRAPDPCFDARATDTAQAGADESAIQRVQVHSAQGLRGSRSRPPSAGRQTSLFYQGQRRGIRSAPC